MLNNKWYKQQQQQNLLKPNYVKLSRCIYRVKMPATIANNLEITIPKVSKYTSARYVAKVLLMNKIAIVRSVRMVTYTTPTGYIQKRAVIVLASWFKNVVAYNLQERLTNNGFAKLVHKSDNAWTLILSNSEDKYLPTNEITYFKIHNVNVYGNTFSSTYLEPMELKPVFPEMDSPVQYMYYKPATLKPDKSEMLMATENMIGEVSRIVKALKEEERKMVQGLKDFIAKRKVVVRIPKVYRL